LIDIGLGIGIISARKARISVTSEYIIAGSSAIAAFAENFMVYNV